MKNIFFIIILIILFSCDRNDEIVGTWVRTGDPFEGMTVEVTSLDNKYIGKIIKVNDIAKEHSYEIHDVKWKNIIKTNNNIYEFQDLRKGRYYGYATFEFQDAFITLQNSNTIIIRQAVKGNETWGTQQLWYKTE